MRKTAIIDIGAAPIDGPQTYEPMLSAGLCTVIGFEPQPEMLARLSKTAGPDETYYSTAIGDGGPHTLHTSAYPGMTSLLPLDMAALSMFQMVSTGSRQVAETVVETARLDDLGHPCDFLRMDVQGAEAMIIDHAHETLAGAVAVQLEMSWIPVYVGQLPIGEMDVKLRGLGFMPHKCIGVRSRAIAGSVNPQESQLLEGDFVYIRDLRTAMTVDQLHHLGMLALHVFGSGDLHRRCANQLEMMGRMGSNTPGWRGPVGSPAFR